MVWRAHQDPDMADGKRDAGISSRNRKAGRRQLPHRPQVAGATRSLVLVQSAIEVAAPWNKGLRATGLDSVHLGRTEKLFARARIRIREQLLARGADAARADRRVDARPGLLGPSPQFDYICQCLRPSWSAAARPPRPDLAGPRAREREVDNLVSVCDICHGRSIEPATRPRLHAAAHEARLGCRLSTFPAARAGG